MTDRKTERKKEGAHNKKYITASQNITKARNTKQQKQPNNKIMKYTSKQRTEGNAQERNNGIQLERTDKRTGTHKNDKKTEQTKQHKRKQEHTQNKESKEEQTTEITTERKNKQNTAKP